MTTNDHDFPPAERDDYAPNPRASQAAAQRARRALGERLETRDVGLVAGGPRNKPLAPSPKSLAVAGMGILAVVGVLVLALSQFRTSGPLAIPSSAPSARVIKHAQEGQRETISATSSPTAVPTLAPSPTAVFLAAPASVPIRHAAPIPQRADWTQAAPPQAPAETGEKHTPGRTKARATAIARPTR